MRHLLFSIIILIPFSAFCLHDTVKVQNFRVIEDAPGLKKGEILRVSGNDTTLVVHPMRSNPNATQVGKDSFVVKDKKTGEYTMYIEYERMPYPSYSFNAYLAQHLTYPDSLQQKQIEGRVNIRFTVNIDGAISNAHVVGKKLHPVLDSIAVAVISRMPKWEPATRYNKPLQCDFTQPVVFKSE